MGVLVLAGTRKGLFLLRADDERRRWQLEEPLLQGWEVMHATVDLQDAFRELWQRTVRVLRFTSRRR